MSWWFPALFLRGHICYCVSYGYRTFKKTLDLLFIFQTGSLWIEITICFSSIPLTFMHMSHPQLQRIHIFRINFRSPIGSVSCVRIRSNQPRFLNSSITIQPIKTHNPHNFTTNFAWSRPRKLSTRGTKRVRTPCLFCCSKIVKPWQQQLRESPPTSSSSAAEQKEQHQQQKESGLNWRRHHTRILAMRAQLPNHGDSFFFVLLLLRWLLF